ncbi:MAG: AarF/UbiB family protein [Moraxella sp.]|nr:AarF/UbiB family protein [Moraxella sp.]
MLLAHRKRLFELHRIAARHRLDSYLPDTAEFSALKRLIAMHPAAFGKQPKALGLKSALEEMGTLFLKLGQLLSTRSDLLPKDIIAELSLLQDKVKPFEVSLAKAIISDKKNGLGEAPETLFARFDEIPLAAASIAQVHTAALKDGREVVVKVVRPDIKAGIVRDFELLRQMAAFVTLRVEATRAVRLTEIIEDYRQIMLGELDLTQEASNSQKMRENFENSPLIYVPEVYLSAPSVMVSERIFGLPISQIDRFDALGYDRGALAKKGLTIFFTQVFRDNFFHADMHPGNVFVETLPDGGAAADPRYIGLDCAIMGELSPDDQLTVARMLLAVMNENFVALVDIMASAGWIPPSADRHALMRDMTRTVSPMIAKPMSELDFAGMLYAVLDVARRHRMSIPAKLVLLLKTLVHVEGLGRELYPELDIWSLAKPILTDWVKEQLDPIKNLNNLKNTLPETFLTSTQLPRMAVESLQSLAQMGARQELILRELQRLHETTLNSRRHDWLTFGGLFLLFMAGLWVAVVMSVWLSPVFFMLAMLLLIWRLTV